MCNLESRGSCIRHWQRSHSVCRQSQSRPGTHKAPIMSRTVSSVDVAKTSRCHNEALINLSTIPHLKNDNVKKDNRELSREQLNKIAALTFL